MKLSLIFFPAFALGVNFSRRSDQEVARINFLDAAIQELTDMIDLVDAGFDFDDADFNAYDADVQELVRSSRDLLGYNRNINHAHQLATRNPVNKRVPGLGARMDYMRRKGQLTKAEYVRVMAQIRIRMRMNALRKLGYYYGGLTKLVD